MKRNLVDFQAQNNFLLIFYVIQHQISDRQSFIVMTIGVYEKLASEKVTDTTWNIGPDFKCILTKNNFLIVDLLDYCYYFDVFEYSLLYSENDF